MTSPVVRRLGTVLGCAALAGCTVSVQSDMPLDPAAASEDATWLDLSDYRVVDLSHALADDSLYWPTGTPFEFERTAWGADESGAWYAAARFAMPEHLGTHLDAPIHFFEDGLTNDEIPARNLVARAVVIDISERADTDPDASLERDDVEAWERRHGPVPEGAIVLVRTGWSSRWPDWNAYYGSEDPFDTATLRFPGISVQAAEALVDRRIAGVGIDTASLDAGSETAFPSHRILAAAGVFGLENLRGLEALGATGATLIAASVKIAGGSGAPARVLALVPESLRAP